MMTDDLKSVLFTEEQIATRVAELGAELTRDYAGKNPLVVGILKGASVFTTDIVRFPYQLRLGDEQLLTLCHLLIVHPSLFSFQLFPS